MSRHFLVIGAQRSGTTYLRSLLDSHPQIYMARPFRPEPKSFLSDEVILRGAEWYRASYFGDAPGDALLGEKSTSYLEYGTAAHRASRVLPRDTSIVVQLRDPVERAVSNWRFTVANGLEDRTLPEAMEESLEGLLPPTPTGLSVSPFSYLPRGRYAEYLDAWSEAFPGRVRVQFLEEVREDRSVIHELFAGLGVDPDFQPPGFNVRENVSGTDAVVLAPHLVERLRDYYRESDEALQRRLGRPLPWREG